MQRYKQAPHNCYRASGEGAGRAGDPVDRWVERTRTYLRSRTLDHWLMFAGGLLLGALLL